MELKHIWNLKEEIKNLPESERKGKILRYLEHEPKSTGRQSISHLNFRANLQSLLELIDSDFNGIWQNLDEYFKRKELNKW